jgi:hypothetical protein
MAQFMLLLRGGGDATKDYTPEQAQQMMQLYYKWSEKLQGEDRMRGGDELKAGGRVVRAPDGRPVVDGPFAETKEAIGGYFLIEARDLDDAADVATGCPILTHGGVVDIREVISM